MGGSVGHMVFWAEIREIQSIGSELVQETTNKVMLIKEKLKAARDCQKSYVGNMRKHLELKLYWTDANLHVHVEEIKVDKTLRFAEEPVEIIDREVKSLKRSRIPISCYVAISTLVWASEVVSSGFPIVKVRRDSKRGPKFTWEREDHMKANHETNKNQRAFVRGSWSDSGEEDDEKIQDETCLVAQAPIRLGAEDMGSRIVDALRAQDGHRKLLLLYKGKRSLSAKVFFMAKVKSWRVVTNGCYRMSVVSYGGLGY
ncbi:hypothetical protein Tco_1163146 [Tanacetum coccineum]